MERYVAFLRGMNLGGRRIKNEELRRHFEETGFEEVATYRASGNVIFSTSSREAEGKLAERMEAELDERLGYDVPVFLRSIDEVAAIAAWVALRSFRPHSGRKDRSASGIDRGARFGRLRQRLKDDAVALGQLQQRR